MMGTKTLKSFKPLIHLLLTSVFCVVIFLWADTIPAKAIGYLTISVTNPNCNGYGATWSYADIDTAVKDTVPVEWWPPNQLGGILTHSGLQTASVIVRSRITWNKSTPLNTNYHYTSANWNSRAVPQPPFSSACNDYTLNTVLNARNYSNTTYNSNLATDQTWNNYIVNISGLPEMIGFRRPTQVRSTVCAEQSDDWRFCAISSLEADLYRENNRYARRLNSEPSNKIRFEAETFASRVARGDAWYCVTSVSGYRNKCFMHSLPNDGTAFAANAGYVSNSPYMEYNVFFPQTNGTAWYVWVSGYGCSYSNDSLHIRVFSTSSPVSLAESMTGWNSCSWQWWSVKENGQRAVITAATDSNWIALKKFQLFMYEDGMRVDRIVLAQDPTYNPTNDSWAN